MIDEYIRRYGRRLYGLCRSLCPNPFDADDLYQETWLRVVKHIGKYDPGREFEPWLTRICVNAYRTALRRRSRSPVLEFSSGEEQERFLQSIPAPEERDYGPLYEAVSRLPDKLRLAVVLFAALVREWYPVLSLAVGCFAILSTAGSGAVAIVYAQRGGTDRGGEYGT